MLRLSNCGLLGHKFQPRDLPSRPAAPKFALIAQVGQNLSMETTGSFTEIKLSSAFSAEGGLEIFQAHGLGQRPIILDALELDQTSLQ